MTVPGKIGLALTATALALGAIGFALGQSLSGTEDVRIAARKLADGKIEFALEQDGQRILPRSRFFPASAQVDRWLRSSPVSIDVEAILAERIRETEQQEAMQSSRSLSGSGDAYQSAGHFAAGHYVCIAEVSENDSGYGSGLFAVTSYGEDGSYGALHVNEIEHSYRATTRLMVGSGWSADVPVGEVFFDVAAAPQGRWSIVCTRQ